MDCGQSSMSSPQLNTPLLLRLAVLLLLPPSLLLPPLLLLPLLVVRVVVLTRMVPPLLTMLLLGAWQGSTSFLIRQRRLGVNSGSRPTSSYPSRS